MGTCEVIECESCARLRAEVERLNRCLSDRQRNVELAAMEAARYLAQVDARDAVIEAAFKALDDAVAGIRYVEQKEHFYGLGADRVEEKYAEARRLRAELEVGK